MNPIEYLDTLETKTINNVKSGPEQYSKDEVVQLLKDIGGQYKKVIFNADHVFELESVDKTTVTVNDTDFVVQKLLTDDNKYLLFLQVVDELGTFEEPDMEQIAEEVTKAVKKSNDIAGLILLPPNFELSLVTAKINVPDSVKKKKKWEDIAFKWDPENEQITFFDESNKTVTTFKQFKQLGEYYNPDYFDTIDRLSNVLKYDDTTIGTL